MKNYEAGRDSESTERQKDAVSVTAANDQSNPQSIEIGSSLDRSLSFDPESRDDLVKVESVVNEFVDTHAAFKKRHDHELLPGELSHAVTLHNKSILDAKDLIRAHRELLDSFDDSDEQYEKLADNAERLVEQLQVLEETEASLVDAAGRQNVEVEVAEKQITDNEAIEELNETLEPDTVQKLRQASYDLRRQMEARYDADLSEHMRTQNDLIREAFISAHDKYTEQLAQAESDPSAYTKDGLQSGMEKLHEIFNMLPMPRGFEWEQAKENDRRQAEFEKEEEETGNQNIQTFKNNLRNSTGFSGGYRVDTEQLDDVYQAANDNPTEVASDVDKVGATVVEKEYGYDDIREGWLAAKQEHERLSTAYKAAAEKEYAQIEENKSLTTRIKTSFGFGPKLSDELDELRTELFEATSEYNKFARAMVQTREVGGKSRIVDGVESTAVTTAADVEAGGTQLITEEALRKQRVMERYQRMLARHTITNTLDNERAVQEATAERLSIKPLSPKQRKSLQYLGAAVVGGVTAAATGGGSMLVGAGQSVLRVLGAGAISGGVAKKITEKSESRIEGLIGRLNERNQKEGSEYEREIAAIAERLAPKRINEGIDESVSPEELEEMYIRLYEIYNQVDAEKKKRIAAILATAIGAGAVMGGGISAVFDTATDVPIVAEPVDITGGVSPNTENSVPQESPIASSPEVAADNMHIVEPGFTVWDYFEGQTAAGESGVMEQVSAEQQQAVINAIESVLDTNAELRAEIGLGASASEVFAGSEINLSALDRAAADVINTEFSVEATPETDVSTDSIVDTPDQESMTVESSDVRFAEAEVEGSSTDSKQDAEAETKVTAAETAFSGSANEALGEAYGATPATVYEYIVSHEGGAAQFLEQFNQEFVAEHQSHHLERGGLFGLGQPKYADAFAFMKGMTIGEIEELVQEDGAEQQAFLEESGIHPDDFNSWVEQIDRAEAEGAVTFAASDRLEETMQAYYIQLSNA
jgi:hypothetical protein